MKTTAFVVAALLPCLAAAQVECSAPREYQDGVREARYAPHLKTLLAAEAIIRSNKAFMSPPEPVRMRTTVAAGPYEPAGARLFVRAYPEKTGVDIQIWTGVCDVIPQAERVAASIGQIDVFFNYPVHDMFLQTGVPKFEGRVGGYPRYNGWVVITQDGRLPWIPQTLADRLDREAEKRDKALADWRQQLAAMKAPDPAVVEKTYALLKAGDPAGAETYRVSMQQLAAELRRRQQQEYPATTAQLEQAVAELQRYRASFSAAELQAPAVWADAGGSARQAPHELADLRPGPAERAIAFKPDPTFPDPKTPTRVQLIALLFSEDPRGQRGPWMKAAKESFDFAALAALLR